MIPQLSSKRSGWLCVPSMTVSGMFNITDFLDVGNSTTSFAPSVRLKAMFSISTTVSGPVVVGIFTAVNYKKKNVFI